MAEQNTMAGLRECNLNSGKGLTRFVGEWVAIPHDIKATGYKAKNAYGHSPVFANETTKTIMERSVMTPTSTARNKAKVSASSSKKLMPYHPNATRNRPKHTMVNVTGSRFGIHPSIKTERYRGSSQVVFESVDPMAKKPWKTNNQMFEECTQVQNTTGLSNVGISSDVAIRMHKKIGIYGS